MRSARFCFLALVLGAAGLGAAVAGGPTRDATMGTWTQVRSLPEAVSEFGAVYLAGRVYALGAFNEPHDLVQVYEVGADRWSLGPSLLAGGHHNSAVTLDGRIWSFGGDGSDQVVQAFNPDTGKWSRRADIPTPVVAMALAVVDGSVHLIGGGHDINSSDGRNYHQIYDPATDRWSSGAPLPLASEHVGAAVVGGKIYVVGGRNLFTALDHTQIYDPAADRWSAGAPLPVATSGMGVVAYNDRVWVFGGEDLTGLSPLFSGETVSAIQRYDPESDRWRVVGDLPRGVHGAPVVVVEDDIYMIGGAFRPASGTPTDQVWRYRPPSPATPGRLRARPRPGGIAMLRWKDASKVETAYEVWVAADDEDFRLAATTGRNAKRFTLGGLVAGGSYRVRVRALSEDAPSEFTDPVGFAAK